jgi:predicted DNA-binding transcriptional regulator YafY
MIENSELERLLLGFGNGLEVLKPEKIRLKMKSILEKALEKYKTDSNEEKNSLTPKPNL